MPWRLPILLALLAFVFVALAEDATLETIALGHRPAEEMAELIRPLLDEGDAVIASRGQLIIKASPVKLAEIRALVEQLDKPLHRLMITLVQGNGLSVEWLAARVNKARLSGEAPQVMSGGSGGHVYRLQANETGTHIQRVQTVAGKAAYIEFGEERPVLRQSIAQYGNRLIVAPDASYRKTTSGFAVTPQLVGKDIVLELSPWSRQVNRAGGGVIDTQSAAMTLRAALGEWVELGGQVELGSPDQTSPQAKNYALGVGKHKIFLKVDDLDAERH